MNFSSRLLSILLAALLSGAPMMAQAPALGSTAGINTASLHIRIVDGDGAALNTGARSVKGFTVEVTDSSGAAVENAAVVLRLPDSEPSGKFADGGLAAIAYTDALGLARIGGIQWGNTPGTVVLRITAAKDTMHTGILLEESLTAAVPVAANALPVPAGTAGIPAARPVKMLPVAAPAVVVTSGNIRPQPVEPGALPAQPTAIEPRAAIDTASPDDNVPLRHFAEAGLGLAEAPSVSIVNSGAAFKSGHSKTKWLIIAAVIGGGAAAGILLAHRAGSGGSSSGVTIGSPSVSVGHP